MLPKLDAKLRRRGIPGVFSIWSRTSKGAANSAASAAPTAWASPCGRSAACSTSRIDYHLRDFDDIVADRGF